MYDAIVVGSGITGGWAAKELTQKGLKTLLLERGRNVEHGKGYITEHKAPWEFKLRTNLERNVLKNDYYIQNRLGEGFLNKTNIHFFFKDSDSPYIENKPFTWIRGSQVGGKSIMWGKQCYRLSNIDFEANLKENIGIDWPIRYKDISPWYDYVEKFIGVSGEKLNLTHLPDGYFQKPMELNVVEKHLRKKLRIYYPERYLTIARCAVLTEPLGGRQPCHYCGPCWRGCSTGSYFSTQSSTLPAAMKTGKLDLRPYSIVESIIYDENKNRALGVRVIDSETKKNIEFFSKVIFLCASTLGSTQIMLNSKSETFPTGIANSSGVLGHFLMDHHHRVSAKAKILGFENYYTYGHRPTGFIIPNFRNISDSSRSGKFLRGYIIGGAAYRMQGWKKGYELSGFGKDFKNSLKTPSDWNVELASIGESLPVYSNHVYLHKSKKDKYGIPQLVFNYEWTSNELEMRKDIANSMMNILEKTGCEEIVVKDEMNVGGIGAEPGICIHEMGTARMGKDPKNSVLNAFNQTHDVPNLFVTDGACMPSSPCQNPSLTYMALTARAANYAINKLKKGEI